MHREKRPTKTAEAPAKSNTSPKKPNEPTNSKSPPSITFLTLANFVPPRRRLRENGIANLIEADTNYLNFGVFYPGKIFKCNLALTNITEHTHIISVYFDSSSAHFEESLLPKAALPEGLQYPIANSEKTNGCWHFMLSPSNKTFDKSFSASLAPHETIQFGVVIKSPCINRPQRFFSLVKVCLSEEDLMSQLLDSGKDSLAVLSEAEVVTPKLECCKELIHDPTGMKIVPLVIKCDSNIQRLRVPFKNAGGRDLELILNVLRYPAPDESSDAEPLAVCRCLPNTAKIPSGAISFISICVSQITKEAQGKREQKILLIKIKDTLMMYSYILDCSFIL
eukprot:TRINITY_DN2181_c0_g1_i7.p1 TRINITY_DN2181_c0_g1~~TRINITY_DN2181_c0_g1_i7.p1  ORF type:complete len:337 (-),score=83.03 TRINITY_DN2181_c0_g1_i7:155-1165(-)